VNRRQNAGKNWGFKKTLPLEKKAEEAAGRAYRLKEYCDQGRYENSGTGLLTVGQKRLDNQNKIGDRN